MKRLLTIGIAVAAVIGARPAEAQRNFEGVIVYRMHSSKRATDVKFSYKGAKTRMEMLTGSGKDAGYQLADGETGKTTFVMVEQKMYMTVDAAAQGQAADQPRPSAETVDEGSFNISATGRIERIADHECEHYLVTTDDDEMDICAAKGLGFMGMFGSNPMARGRQTGPNIPLQYRHLAKAYADGFQPLKVERIKGNERELVLEAISIARETLEDGLFIVPKNFNEFSMSGAMSDALKRGVRRRRP